MNDEEKLLMIYLNEADQKDIDACLSSAERCGQLDQLEADMNAIEQAHKQRQLPEDYGQQLWNKISDQLVSEKQQTISKERFLHRLSQWFLQPQYSLASFAVILGLIFVAFMTGKQQGSDEINLQLREHLLAQNIQLHLSQSEIFLTQVSNGNGPSNKQDMAERLLASNRIFKQALTNHEGQFTYQLLNDLEPILLEFANGAPTDSNAKPNFQPSVNYVNQSESKDLMFQIKAMKKQLANKNDII